MTAENGLSRIFDLNHAAAANDARILSTNRVGLFGRRRGNLNARRRNRVARSVAVVGIVLAAWVGSLLGSGALNGEARFHSQRLAAQQGARVEFGTPAIHGHRGASVLVGTDMIRQFIALDGVN